MGPEPDTAFKDGRLTPILAWLGKCQRLEFMAQAKCLRATVSHDPITQLIVQGHLFDPTVILLTSVWDHVDTWSSAIFNSEGNEVQNHIMQLADCIPRDQSVKRFSDLPKGIY